MFGKQRRSGRIRLARPILLLLAVTLIAAVVACSGGVSEEEFNAVKKDLAIEKTQSQAQETELAKERAETARLVEAVDRFEARIAELKSELAKERAAIAKTQERVDAAEAESALLAAFLAWNRKDQEGFAASFIDLGSAETVLSIPENLGQPSLALRHVRDTIVSGDTATIQAMFALGTQRNSVRYSMAKQGGIWKIEGEERLSPKIKGHTTVVDVTLDGCASLSESETVVEGHVAFKVENTSAEHPHLILKKVPEDIDSGRLLQSDVVPYEGVEDVAFVRETRAGESINIAFTEPLEPGRYVLVCYPQDSGGIEEVRPDAEGIVATFRVK